MRYILTLLLIIGCKAAFAQNDLTVLSKTTIVSPVNPVLSGNEITCNFAPAGQQNYVALGDSVNVYITYVNGTIVWKKFACLSNPENPNEYTFRDVASSPSVPIVYFRGYLSGGNFKVSLLTNQPQNLCQVQVHLYSNSLSQYYQTAQTNIQSCSE